LKNGKRQIYAIKRLFKSIVFFPLATLVLYGTVAVLAPEKALFALKNSLNVLLQMIIPLFLIFILMVVINRFLNPAKIAKHLGKGSGVQAMLLSAAAGILSAGPIYAWYPLLKDLRDKGAGESSIAIFLYNRAVKPFLLPVMIGYFGWLYVIILTILMVFTSVAVGFSVSSLASSKKK